MNKTKYSDAITKAHYIDGKYRNSAKETIPFSHAWQWYRDKKKQKLPHPPADGYAAFIEKWVSSTPLTQVTNNSISWLGHSSVLIQTPTLRIITDPVFSHRISPIKYFGPTRKTPNIFIPKEQTPIDVVLISHNHYDHLDKASILSLLMQKPDMTFLVPLGLKKWFLHIGAINVQEFDWWEHITLGSTEFCLVPAQHWSRRRIKDKNHSLWGGWIIDTPEHTLYFAGDTALSNKLLEIGNLFDIDVALLPIGAYEPRWFMKHHHMSPEQAIELHQRLKAKRSLAIHWGVFELANESIDEPCRLLRELCQQQNIDDNEFILLQIGASMPL